MKLSFENIGKVAKAEIEIDLITVIAGANDTGKSTAGKILYSIYTALHELKPEKLLGNKVKSLINDEKFIANLMGESYFNFGKDHFGISFFYERLTGIDDLTYISIENRFNKLAKDWIIKLQEYIKNEQLPELTKDKINMTCENMFLKINAESNSKKIWLSSIQEILLIEFSDALTTELCENPSSKIYLKEDTGDEMKFEFLGNEIDYTLSNVERKRDYAQPFYVDNPFILDELNNPRSNVSEGSFKHNDKIISAIENPLAQNHFEKMLENQEIRDILDSVLEGRIFKKGKRYRYQTNKMLNPVDIESLSTGMKSFAILKMLFDSRQLEFVILDEPEIHLHPEWKLKYAEFVVLLASKRPIQIVITTHSPYFIEAIELYSKKYGIGKYVRYYNALNYENGMSEFFDVTEKLEVLYESMSEPFQILEELRDELDEE